MFEINCYTHMGLGDVTAIRELAASKDIPSLHYSEEGALGTNEALKTWGKTTEFTVPFVCYKTMENGDQVCHFVEGADEVVSFLEAL